MTALRLELKDGLAELVLSRPPLNLLSIEMIHEIRSCADSLGPRPIRAVLVSAEGRNFSAGADVREHTRERLPELLQALRRMTESMLRLEVPVICAVRGACLGGGMELALTADIIYAATDASFGQPEVRLAAMAPIAAVLLPRRIGPARAVDMLFTGRTVPAGEAEAWGLVSRTVPAAELDSFARARTQEIAQSSRPALVAAKRALLETRDVSIGTALHRATAIYLDYLSASSDAAEGIRAFCEKRTPEWTHA